MTPIPKISRPANGALAHEGIDTLEQLSRLTEKEFLAIHGVGPKALPIIREAFVAAGLEFRRP